MKSKWLIAVVLMISTFYSRAQFTELGVQVKYQASRQLFDDLKLAPKFARSVTDMLYTPGYGVYAGYKIGDKWKIRGKIGAETRGTAKHYDSNDGARNDKVKFNYITADLVANFNLGSFEKVQPYIAGGFSFAYLYKVKLETLEYEIFGENAYKQEFGYDYYDYANFGCGGTVGLGVNIKNFMWIEGTYYHDIIAPVSRPDLKIYNRSWALSIGFNVLNFFD